MTYASGGLIQASDYQALAWTNPSIGGQWGIGTGQHGLGQNTSGITLPSNGVAPGNPVTAAQWVSLIQSINSCLAHEGQPTITPTSVTAGNIITYYSSIATGSAAAYNNTGTTSVLTAGSTNTTSFSGTWGSTGSRSLVFTQTMTFPSGDAARYFFNGGGNIALTFTRSGGSATNRNTEWTQLATDCGTIKFGFLNTTKTGGGGASPTTILNAGNGGYWNGTGSYVTNFKQLDNVGNYSSNYIKADYFWSGSISNGGYPILNLKTTWVNDWINAFQDTVDGVSSTSLVLNSPATTYITNTWGTPVFSGSVAAV